MKNHLANNFNFATGSIDSGQSCGEFENNQKNHSTTDVILLVLQIIGLILQVISTVAAVLTLLGF